jgi:magnesium and cobalt transporter
MPDTRSYWKRLQEFIHPGPDSREELLGTLTEAEDNHVIDAESRVMLEGVLRMAELTAGHVMVAAARMDLIDLNASLDDTLNQVIDTRHSRFPVFEGERDNLVGILLAKDLLKLQRSPTLNLRTLLRPPVFIPESKGLNDLLRDFRNNRNHMALVVDEFGRVAGLITIEDVLEQIVGEIEDEFDEDPEAGDVFALADKTYRVSGDSSLERVVEAFELDDKVFDNLFDSDNKFDTIGGLIAHAMGHVPRRGEYYELAGLRFTVQHTRGGAVKWFKVHLPGKEPTEITRKAKP